MTKRRSPPQAWSWTADEWRSIENMARMRMEARAILKAGPALTGSDRARFVNIVRNAAAGLRISAATAIASRPPWRLPPFL